MRSRLARAYTDDELALYARYRDQRAEVRPLACVEGDGCWVEAGPPALIKNGSCSKCRGSPGLRHLRAPVA